MKIENKIIKTTLENWKDLVPFQPKDFKIATSDSIEKLVKSFKQNGKINAFMVWENNGKLLIIDGHTTQEVLLVLEKEGYDIPDKLTCNWLGLKDEQEAVKAVLIYNSHYKDVNENSLSSWIKVYTEVLP